MIRPLLFYGLKYRSTSGENCLWNVRVLVLWLMKMLDFLSG